MDVFRSPVVRRTVLLWLGVAILFAQGLRVCLHGHDYPPHVGDASLVHVESTLSILNSHDEANTDGEIPLAMLLKLLASLPFDALLLATVLLFVIAQEQQRFALATNTGRIPDRPPHFSPPGRAPPR